MSSTTTTTSRRQMSFSSSSGSGSGSGFSSSNPIPIPSSSSSTGSTPSTSALYTPNSPPQPGPFSTPRIVRFDSECVLIPDLCAPSASGLKLASLGVMGTRSVALPLWKRGLKRKSKGKDKDGKDKDGRERGGMSATSGEEDDGDDVVGLGYHLHRDEDEEDEERSTRVVIRVPIPTFRRHTSQSPTRSGSRRAISASPTIPRNIPSCLANAASGHRARSPSASHVPTTSSSLVDEIPVIDALEIPPASPTSSSPPLYPGPIPIHAPTPQTPVKASRKITLSPIRKPSSPPTTTTPSTSPPTFSTPAFLAHHTRSSSHSQSHITSNSNSNVNLISCSPYTRRPSDTTIPLRSCCLTCNTVMDECVNSVLRGEEWEERFSRGARRRRRSSSATSVSPVRGPAAGASAGGSSWIAGMGGEGWGGRVWEMSGERKFGFESAVESMVGLGAVPASSTLPSAFDDDNDNDPESPIVPPATFNLTVDEVDKRRKSVDLSTLPVSFTSSLLSSSSPSPVSPVSPKTNLKINTSHSPASAGYVFPSRPVATPSPTSDPGQGQSSSLHPYAYVYSSYDRERRASPISEGSEGSASERASVASGRSGRSGRSAEKENYAQSQTQKSGKRISGNGSYFTSRIPSSDSGRNSPLYSVTTGGAFADLQRRSPGGTPRDEEDEAELFPLPSPRRSPRGTPSPNSSVANVGAPGEGASPKLSPKPSPKPSPSVSPRVSPRPSPAGSTASLVIVDSVSGAGGGGEKDKDKKRSSAMLSVTAGVYVKRIEVVRKGSGASTASAGLTGNEKLSKTKVEVEVEAVDVNGSAESLTLLGEGLRRRESPAPVHDGPTAATKADVSPRPAKPVGKRPMVHRAYSLGSVDDTAKMKAKDKEEHGMHFNLHIPHPHFGLGIHTTSSTATISADAGEDTTTPASGDVASSARVDEGSKKRRPPTKRTASLSVPSTSNAHTSNSPSIPTSSADSASTPPSLPAQLSSTPSTHTATPAKRKLSLTAGIKRVGGGVLRGVSSIASGGTGVGM
ncbi:hypothetical protein BJ165DRAFT_256470 [Panaeolus papilionaceus]|nr:hypothetical protein BJ165DRAFT_256470 [Panaeolus papilionaceus]